MNHLKYSGHTLQKKELIFCNVSDQQRIKVNKISEPQFTFMFNRGITVTYLGITRALLYDNLNRYNHETIMSLLRI